MESNYNDIVELLKCLQMPAPMNQEGMYDHYNRIYINLLLAKSRIELLTETLEVLKESWK
jgi:hypothetical protein